MASSRLSVGVSVPLATTTTTATTISTTTTTIALLLIIFTASGYGSSPPSVAPTTDPCFTWSCSKDCDGLIAPSFPCGWDIETNVCRKGFITTQAEKDGLFETSPGDCNHHTLPPTTSPTVSPTEDPCYSLTCSKDCDNVVITVDASDFTCGWDGETNLCRTGFFTKQSEVDALLETNPGDCGQYSAPPTVSPSTIAPSQPPSVSPTADPCLVLRCAADCDGPVVDGDGNTFICGWDIETMLCRTGFFTKQQEKDDLWETSPGDCSHHTLTPSVSPTRIPSASPSTSPTSSPSVSPSTSPSVSPSTSPTLTPTTSSPSTSPTISPTMSPTITPTAIPTTVPTSSPTVSPTTTPTISPSSSPTTTPTTSTPTVSPSVSPSTSPTTNPSAFPTGFPTALPTSLPTAIPSQSPTTTPTSSAPTISPTFSPSQTPSISPTSNVPTVSPTTSPTASPTQSPTRSPTTSLPTASPSTSSPTTSPSISPTSSIPSMSPTSFPTTPTPTATPTISPTATPTTSPTPSPTATPTTSPTANPTTPPTSFPTSTPSASPTLSPTLSAPSSSPTTPTPTQTPSRSPTLSPTTSTPTASPTTPPTVFPSLSPSFSPTRTPSRLPSATTTLQPTIAPTPTPTEAPSRSPSISPSISVSPTTSPTASPSCDCFETDECHDYSDRSNPSSLCFRFDKSPGMCTSMDRLSVIQCCQTCCLVGCHLRQYATTTTPTTVPTMAPTPSPPTCTTCYYEPADVVFVSAGASTRQEYTTRIKFIKTIVNAILTSIDSDTIRVAHVSHSLSGVIHYNDFANATVRPLSKINTIASTRPSTTMEICSSNPNNDTLCEAEATTIVRQTADFVLKPDTSATASGFRGFNVPTWLVVIGNDGGNHYVADRFAKAYSDITTVNVHTVMLDEHGLDDADARERLLSSLCSGNLTCALGMYESSACNTTNDRVCSDVTNCTCDDGVSNCTLAEPTPVSDYVCAVAVSASNSNNTDNATGLYIALVIVLLVLIVLIVLAIRYNTRRAKSKSKGAMLVSSMDGVLFMREKLPSPLIMCIDEGVPKVVIEAAEDIEMPGQFSQDGTALDIYFTISDTTDGGPPMDVDVIPDHKYSGAVELPTEVAAVYTIQAVAYLEGRLRSSVASEIFSVVPAPTPTIAQLSTGEVEITVPEDCEVIYSISAPNKAARAHRLTSTKVVLGTKEAKEGVTITARAIKSGCAPSDQITFAVQAFVIVKPRIDFEKLQDDQEDSESYQITITCDTADAVVYYVVFPIASDADDATTTPTTATTTAREDVFLPSASPPFTKKNSTYDTVSFIQRQKQQEQDEQQQQQQQQQRDMSRTRFESMLSTDTFDSASHASWSSTLPRSPLKNAGDLVLYNPTDKPVVAVSSGQRLRVKAYATKLGQSSEVAIKDSSLPIISSPTTEDVVLPGEIQQVSTVTTVLKPGKLAGEWIASFACDTPGVTVFFTTDGSAIDETSRSTSVGASNTLYPTDGNQVHITAQATKDDMLPSATSSLRMHLEQVSPVMIVLEPIDGNSDTWHLSFQCVTEGATICFSTDDTDVDINSKGVGVDTVLSILPALGEPMKVRAIARKFGMTPSAESVKEACVIQKAMQPTVEVREVRGSDDEFEIVLHSDTRGAAIYYTLDGSKIENGKLYDPNNKPTFVPKIGEAMKIQVRATMPGMLTSDTFVQEGRVDESDVEESEEEEEQDSAAPRMRSRSSTLAYDKVQMLLRKVLESDFDAGDNYILSRGELEELCETEHLKDMLPYHIAKHMKEGSNYAVANAAVIMDMCDRNNDGTISVSDFLSIYKQTPSTSSAKKRSMSTGSLSALGYSKKYTPPPGYLSSNSSANNDPIYDFASTHVTPKRPPIPVRQLPARQPSIYDVASSHRVDIASTYGVDLSSGTDDDEPPLPPRSSANPIIRPVTVSKFAPTGNSDEWTIEFNCNTPSTQVRFTTDGSDVQPTSELIEVNTPFYFIPELGVPVEIKGVAEVDGVFHGDVQCRDVIELNTQVATPAMSGVSTLQDDGRSMETEDRLAVETKSNELEITMTCMTSGANIFYVVGDDDIFIEGKQYHAELKPKVNPLPNKPVMITARAVCPGMIPSEMVVETFEARFKSREVQIVRRETMRGKLVTEQFLAFGAPAKFVKRHESTSEPRVLASRRFNELVPISKKGLRLTIDDDDDDDDDSDDVKVIDVKELRKNKSPLSRSGSGKDLLLLMGDKERRNEAQQLAEENKVRARRRASRVADLTDHVDLTRTPPSRLYQFALSEEEDERT